MAGAPQRLRCEFVTNPLGVVGPRPRFSWWVTDTRPAEIQTAYEILVSSTADHLARDEGDLWSSGQVASQDNAQIFYHGQALEPGQKCWWKVRTFDSDGLTSPWSDVAHFQMGAPLDQPWPGYWMSAPFGGSRSQGVQVVAMRREFEAHDVVAAHAYIVALGAYVFAVNGRDLNVGGAAPVWSDFNHDLYYQTFDLLPCLQEGPNAVGLLLGDGYYAGALPDVGRCAYGDKPKVRCVIELKNSAGQTQVIQSDHRWHWRSSWIVGAEINGGEHIDLRQYLPGWSSPCHDESGWSVVELENQLPGPFLSQPYSTRLQAETVFPNEPDERFGQLAVQESGDPSAAYDVAQLHANEPLNPDALITVGEVPAQSHDGEEPTAQIHNAMLDFDFGTVLVGRGLLSLRTRYSDDVRVHYSLTEDFSNATTDSCTTLDAGPSTVAGGASLYPVSCEFAPQFSMHSFRYMRVEFTQGRTEIEHVAARVFSYPSAGGLSFSSDHETLDDLVKVLNSSINAVAMSVPMRGVAIPERLPDVAYAKTWMPRLAEEERAHGLVLKWLADMATALQLQYTGEKAASPYAPSLSQFQHADFIDEMACYETFVQTLWSLYRHQDDLQVLQSYYDHVRVGALAYRHQSSDLLRHNPYPDLYGDGALATLVASAESYAVLRLAARIASVLGHMGDYERIDDLAVQARKAWRYRFVTPSGHLAADTQSAYVSALYHEMLEPDEYPAASSRLVELLVQSQYHAQVLPAVVRALLPTLTQIGRLDLAYMVLLQTSQPSWLGSIHAGDKLVGRVPGDFDIADIGLLEWLVRSVVGLSVDPDYSLDRNGYRSVRIQPHPPFGAQFLAGSPVTRMAASLPSPQGTFVVEWRIEDHAFKLEVVLPPGSAGVVVMPDGIEQQVRSGRHKFVMDFNAGGDGVPLLVDVS